MAKFKDNYKPECTLVGTDGNAFGIIGTVKKALKNAGMPDRAEQWQKEAFKQKSYDDLLALCWDYVEVQ